MTKQKLTLAELQLNMVALDKNHEAKVLGGGFWSATWAWICANAVKHEGKNVKSASVEM